MSQLIPWLVKSRPSPSHNWRSFGLFPLEPVSSQTIALLPLSLASDLLFFIYTFLSTINDGYVISCSIGETCLRKLISNSFLTLYHFSDNLFLLVLFCTCNKHCSLLLVYYHIRSIVILASALIFYNRRLLFLFRSSIEFCKMEKLQTIY